MAPIPKLRQAHFYLLDAVRGVAAYSVVLYHLGHWLGSPWIAANSALAVDLFFCLSGFILSFTYLSRPKSPTLTEFVYLRLVRLMPTIILGSTISFFYIILRGCIYSSETPTTAIVFAYALSLLNLPNFWAPISLGGAQVFPLNGPQYTLFLELLANITWWSLCRNNSNLLLIISVILSGLITLSSDLGGDTIYNFWSGIPRVFLSFSIGCLVFNIRHLFPENWPWRGLFIVVSVISIAIFYAPVTLSMGMQMLWIVFASPILILSGSKSTCPDSSKQLFHFLGMISYPIYALHFPLFIWINGFYAALFSGRNIWLEGMVLILVATMISTATAFYYEPVVRKKFTGFFS